MRNKRHSIKRMIGFLLSSCLVFAAAPAAAYAADQIYAKPFYTDPAPGNAAPASADGSIQAVPYTYSDTSLLGANNSWFSYTGSEDVQFEAEFLEPSGISDCGTVEFNASTAPYITYTPSAAVADQTVKFKVKATAGSASVTGEFYWTVNVGSVPDAGASDNASLTALTYQVGNGTPVAIPLQEGVFDYTVSLTANDYNKNVILSGTASDSGATISSESVSAGYWPETASLTVTAANKSTTQTYHVEFSIPQKETSAQVSVNGITCWDGSTVKVNPVYVTPGEKQQLLIDCGGGEAGYGSYYVVTHDLDIAGKEGNIIGNQWGINDYPNRFAALPFTLQDGDSFQATVYFYKEHTNPLPSLNLTPVQTIELTVIGGDTALNQMVATVTIGDQTTSYSYGEGGGYTYKTAIAALQAAWKEAQNGTDVSPATLHLVQSVDMGTNPANALTMTKGNVILTMAKGASLFGSMNNGNTGIINVENGTLTMQSGMVENTVSTTEVEAVYAIGVYVKKNTNAIFNLTGGTVNGRAVSGESQQSWYGHGIYIEYGQVHITGGEVRGSDSGVQVQFKGSLVVDGGEIKGVAEVKPGNLNGQPANNGTGIAVNNGTAVINGGTIRSGNGYGVFGEGENADITINGGTIIGEGSTALEMHYGKCRVTNGTFQGKGNSALAVYVGSSSAISIEGGTFTSERSRAIWMKGGILHIEGGTYRGYHAVQVDGGTVDLDGGEFTGTSDNTIAINAGTVHITGGTYTSDNYYGNAVSVSTAGELKLSGGTFKNTSKGSGGSVKCYNPTTLANLLVDGYAYYEGETVSPDKKITEGLDGIKLSQKTVTVGYADSVGAKLYGYTLSLSGNIGVNFYMELSDDVLNDEEAYMEFTLPGGNHTEEKVMVSAVKNDPKTVDGKTYYVFPCGIAAKDMTGEIKAQIVLGNGTTGEAYTYTVKEYADYIIHHEVNYGQDAVEMVKALLNYGGYAQQHFGHNTGDLANADLNLPLPENATVLGALGTTYDSLQNGSAEGLTYVGTSLMTVTETSIRHYFTVEEGHKIEDYTFTCTETGETLTPVPKGSYYYVEIRKISAKDLSTMYTLSVNNNAYTISYSAYTNIKAILSDSTGSFTEDARNAMKAMYQYGEAAKDYFNK